MPSPPVQALLPRKWRALPGATASDIARLLTILPFEPPSSYLELLRATNGGEGELNLQPLWFSLFDVDFAIHLWNEPDYRQEYPGHFFFGSNGGLESIALKMIGEPWPVVSIDTVAGLKSSLIIANCV